MAEIRPFRGVHYNRRRIKELALVICPPYDIISPQFQEELYKRSQYNFVRLEYARELPQDNNTDNKYTRSAAILGEWLDKGILVTDDEPAIYLHDHHFTYRGLKYVRRGIAVRVRLEEQNGSNIRPHEGTLSAQKSDRLSLLWACQANISPIFAIFEDKQRQISSLLSGIKPGRPVISSRDADGESHNIWAITGQETVEQICRFFSDKPLYIADGHHRYESAQTYRRERLSCSPSSSEDEPFNFVMMTLVDFADPGLLILPPHRLVRGLAKTTLDELRGKLESFFDVEELALNMPDVWEQVDSLTAEPDKIRLVFFGLTGERLMVLTLRDFNSVSRMMPYFHGELYKKLEVSIIDHVILEEMLGLSGGHREAILNYSYDREDAVNKVRDGEYQLTFLLKPIKADVIKTIADAGDRMPKKSTYFYPKVPAGLVVYRLV
ncbi:MAG: DUF1015 domain-containing protein [bacterium]|nr:DUF1015 domain-containing protein [bacterium]